MKDKLIACVCGAEAHIVDSYACGEVACSVECSHNAGCKLGPAPLMFEAGDKSYEELKASWEKAVKAAEDRLTTPKQVLVVRYKYPDGKGGMRKVRTGKLIAQAAHASMKVFFDRMVPVLEDGTVLERPEASCLPYYRLTATQPMSVWKEGIFTKVVVGVTSEQELLDLMEQAKNAGIPTALVKDKGMTEFHGVETATCLAIGPDLPEYIDPITGRLELL